MSVESLLKSRSLTDGDGGQMTAPSLQEEAGSTTVSSLHEELEVKSLVNHQMTKGNVTGEFHHDGSLDAQVAAVCMTLLLVLLLFSVLYSRMWKGRDEWMGSQVIVPEGDIFSAGPQVNLKQLIQTKLRHLRHIIVRKKRKQGSLSVMYQRVDEEEAGGSDTEEEELFVANQFR